MLTGFFVLPGFAVYFAAKWFGLNRISAFFAGFIALGTAGGFELGGPLDIMYYGLYEFAVAIALIPLILSIYHQSFLRRSWTLLLVTAALLAFEFMLHTLAGGFAIAVLIVYTLAELLRLSILRTRTRRIVPISKTIFKFVVIALIVLGICSFWIIPAFTNRSFYDSQRYLVGELGNYATTYNDLHLGYIFGEESTPLIINVFQHAQNNVISMKYSTSQLILTSNTPMFYEFLLALAALGSMFALVQKKSRFPVMVILLLTGLFLFISLGPKYYESLWQDRTFQMFVLRPARAASVARIFLAILAGAGIGEIYSILGKFSNKIRLKRIPRIVIKVVSIAVVIFLGITLVVNSYTLMNQLPIASTTSNLSSGNDVTKLFSWIGQNVPNSSRVAYEEYTTDDQHLFAASPVETGLQEIGSGYEFWWQGADTSSTLESVLSNDFMFYYSGQDLYNTLAGLNAEYVVTWGSTSLSSLSPPSQNITQHNNFQYGHPFVSLQSPTMSSETPVALSQDTSNFHLAYQVGPFYVYQLNNFTASYVSILGGRGIANVTSFEPEKIVIHLSNVSTGSRLLVRISYFTNWVAYSSFGAQLPVSPINISLPLDSANYMSIPLLTNGTYNITLIYGQTSYDTMGNAISLFTLIVLSVGFIFVETTYDIRTFPVAKSMIPYFKRASRAFKSSKKI